MAIKGVQITANMTESGVLESEIRGHRLYVDQPKQLGGEDKGPTPLEYFFLSLAGCIASIGKIVAKQRRIELRGMAMRVEGELDTDVLMGKNSETRSGFPSIRVFVQVDADLSDDQKQSFLQEVERRCPVSDNISGTTSVSVWLEA